MTAIGFFLFVVGFFILRIWGLSALENRLGRFNNADYIGAAMALVGSLLLILSVTLFLWRVFP